MTGFRFLGLHGLSTAWLTWFCSEIRFSTIRPTSQADLMSSDSFRRAYPQARGRASQRAMVQGSPMWRLRSTGLRPMRSISLLRMRLTHVGREWKIGFDLPN
jgi:hypothetical protein